jgi:hypothetical protein
VELEKVKKSLTLIVAKDALKKNMLKIEGQDL